MDLVFEGSIEIVKSRKVSKWIRYPLITILSLFFIAVIGLIGIIGVTMLIKHIDLFEIGIGIIFIVFDFIFILSVINNIKKEFYIRNKK